MHVRLPLFVVARLFSALALLAAPIVVFAHHSFGAVFDANQPVTLTGVVTRVEWTNPHSHLYLDVKDDKGAIGKWALEGYPATVLARTGWTRDQTVKIGDTVTIFGWKARDGSNLAHLRQVSFADGRKLFFGPPAGTGEGAAVVR